MKPLVVCAKRYNGHELWTALGVMKNQGHTFEVVSQHTLIEDEVTGQRNSIARTVHEVNVDEMADFDGIMIVSGNMQDTEAYWKDKHVLDLIAATDSQDKPVSAICCSVPTIRHVAKGKKVSFFPLVRSRMLLHDAGAILTTVAITVDGKLATAEHQMATQVWAEQFSRLLDGLEGNVALFDSGYTPKGRERKPIKGVASAVKAIAQQKEFWITESVDENTMMEFIRNSAEGDIVVHYHPKGGQCIDDCATISLGTP